MGMNIEHVTAQKLMRDLAAAGLELSKDITAAHAALAAVEALKPPDPTGTISDAFVAGDPDLAHARAVARSVARALTEGWAEAIRRTSVDVTRAVTSDGADLLEQLAAKAAPMIADLTTAAGIDVDLQVLVRAGRTDDARVVADVDITTAHLADLFGLRDRIVGRHPWGPCKEWRNPEALPRVTSLAQSPSARTRAGIRAGAGLWFPSPTEASSRAAALAAAANATRATETQGPRRRVAVML